MRARRTGTLTDATPPPEQPTTGPDTHRRPGPRPLPLHLMMTAHLWMGSNAGLPLLKGALPPWSVPFWNGPMAERVAALREAAADVDADRLAAALDEELNRRLDAFLSGVSLYRSHPYRRPASRTETVWQEGTTRLLAYAPPATRKGTPHRAPVLLVPSLINRAYVLDLMPGASFVDSLTEAGHPVYLVDWGAPGGAERTFTLTDYVGGRLLDALEHVSEASGRPAAVIGYCMGGLLALPLGLLAGERVASMVLMATPWDFRADRSAEACLPMVSHLASWCVETLGELPVDAVQAMFAATDPYLAVRKFAAFAHMDPASDRARRFVAIEDWLNDGVPLAGQVARECLFGWYGGGTPEAGEWRVAGRPVRPELLSVPTLSVIPLKDRIVPPASARRLSERLPGNRRLEPAFGHIGMIASETAPRVLWPHINGFLAEQETAATR